jgi:DNA-binding Lrp family transcriptional regulator
MKQKADTLDFRIMEELDRDSRTPNVLIARKLGMSEGAVRHRIGRLAAGGFIKKFTIEFGVKTGAKAFILVSTVPQTPPHAISEFLKKMPEVRSFFHTSGEWDLVVRVFTENPGLLNQAVNRIRSQKWVLATESLVVLDVG